MIFRNLQIFAELDRFQILHIAKGVGRYLFDRRWYSDMPDVSVTIKGIDADFFYQFFYFVIFLPFWNIIENFSVFTVYIAVNYHVFRMIRRKDNIRIWTLTYPWQYIYISRNIDIF